MLFTGLLALMLLRMISSFIILINVQSLNIFHVIRKQLSKLFYEQKMNTFYIMTFMILNRSKIMHMKMFYYLVMLPMQHVQVHIMNSMPVSIAFLPSFSYVIFLIIDCKSFFFSSLVNAFQFLRTLISSLFISSLS